MKTVVIITISLRGCQVNIMLLKIVLVQGKD